MAHNIAVIVGSLRKDSFNRKLAKAVMGVAPASLHMSFVEIGDLTPFSQDLEANPPASWVAFREQIKPVAGVLFATPEYNRSIPGVLKNAIDIGSRPYGQSVWGGKPVAIISGGFGATGGFGANHHLRQVLAYLDMPTMGQPEAYIGGIGDMFDEHGAIKNPKTTEFLAKFAEAFAAWVDTHVKA